MDPSLLILFILAVKSPKTKAERDHHCFVSPKDQAVEVGSDVEVIYQAYCGSGRIVWTLNNKPVKESLSRPLNFTHSILSLRNVTDHSSTVEWWRVDSHQIIGGTIITTYTKPRNVTCILQYENEFEAGLPQLLTCSWEHDASPSDRVNYSLMFNSSSHSSKIEICSAQFTYCTVKGFFQSEEINHYIGNNFSVSVRARTNKWNVDSDPYSFHPNRILKVKPPQFAVRSFADHVLLEWNKTKLSPDQNCEVKYKQVSTSDEETPELVFNKTLSGQKMEIQIKEGLESCLEYGFSVRCARIEAPWSDWSRQKTLLTKLNRKHIRVRLWRRVTEVESNGDRRVRAMWTEIPSSCPGSFTYILCSENQTWYSSSGCEIKLNQDSQMLNLTVFQDQVLLAEASVYLPAISESLPQVTNISTSAHDGVILVKWSAPAQPVSGYVIDWTDGNQYDWKETKVTNATLLGLQDLQPYNITITPLLDNKTGHSSKTIQICSRIGDPGTVSITTAEASDKHVDVSWNTKPHNACSGPVVNYTIYYWIREGKMFNVTVDGREQKVVLRGLSPETQYRVYVEASALTGTSSSKERRLYTKTFDPDLIKIITISGSVIIVLVFILGLSCAILWKKFMAKPVPNPALSSLALWPSLNQQKGMCFFQAFSNPSESTCDKIYTEETSLSSCLSLERSSNCNSDQNYSDSSLVQDHKPARPPSSLEESTTLTSSEHSPPNPYRSQTSSETLRQKGGKRVKEPEKASVKTIYVTLDMFDHGQDG